MKKYKSLFKEKNNIEKEFIDYDLSAIKLNDKIVGFQWMGQGRGKNVSVDKYYDELEKDGWNQIVDDWILDPNKSKPAKYYMKKTGINPLK